MLGDIWVSDTDLRSARRGAAGLSGAGLGTPPARPRGAEIDDSSGMDFATDPIDTKKRRAKIVPVGIEPFFAFFCQIGQIRPFFT